MRNSLALLMLLGLCHAAQAQDYAPPITGEFNGHSYRIVFSTETFEEAFQATQEGRWAKDKWYLASVDSAEENTFVTSGLLFDGQFWLGGFGIDCGDFNWLGPDGPFSGYTNWAVGQPAYCAAGLDFITITSAFPQSTDGQWVNLPDNLNSSGYVLELISEPNEVILYGVAFATLGIIGWRKQ